MTIPEYSILQTPTARNTADNDCEADCTVCTLKQDCSNPKMDTDEDFSDGSCPECGKQVEHEGGCVICRYCGYSKCG